MSESDISNSRDQSVYATASALGIIAGLRSMMAPAVVSYIAKHGCTGASPGRFGVLSNPGVNKVLLLLVGVELIADKLPFMPSRTNPIGLAGRVLTGALCGATICHAMYRSRFVGAFAGSLGALGSTFAGFYVRSELVEALGIPDVGVALAEDAFAVLTGNAICSGLAASHKVDIDQN